MDFVIGAWLQEPPEPELKDTSRGNSWSTSRGKRILAERVGFEALNARPCTGLHGLVRTQGTKHLSAF